jgi:hypothetical protein
MIDEERMEYIQHYFEHEGIELDPNKIERNPGLRVLAKLMLNSFWGINVIFKLRTYILIP